MNKTKFFAWLPLITLSVLLAGCGGSRSGTTTGTISLAVADTPVDTATSVVVTFTGVQFQEGSGPATTFNFSPPKQIDLMTTHNGNAATLLDGATLPAGNYQWIRLMVDTGQSTITLSDGSTHTLSIPSASHTGLKLVSGFSVASGGHADFIIDFNLRKSITQASGSYMLTPALRLVDNQQSAKISGSATNTFMIGTTSITSTTCSPAVYIYRGSDVTPTDINMTSTVQPVTTAALNLNNTTGNYDYSAAFLEPGYYTLAVTCAAADDPTIANALTFSSSKNATVALNATATVDFP